MRFLLASAALAAILIPSAACAAPPAAIEKEARDRVVGAATEGMTAEEIKDPETVPPWMLKVKSAMFKKVDINGDKLPDWMVDYEEAPNPSFFCGTGGCQRELYVGEADGTFRKVYSHGGAMKLSGPKTARRLEVNFHGSVCGSYGASECLRAYRWDATLGRYVETPNSKGLALLASGPMPAITPSLANAPAEVRADMALRRKACEAAGATLPDEEAVAYDIPDINGDGQRDWVVGSPYDDCQWEADHTDGPPSRVLFLATRPDGSLAKALEIAEDGWDLDLAASPAQVILIKGDENCGVGDSNPCPRQPLKWDAATATLRP